MKKIFFLFFILFCSYIAKSQIATIFADEFIDSAKTKIGIIGNYDLNSNAFTTSFLIKFYTGGYLDKDLRNSVLARSKNINRVGANVNYGVFAAFKLDPNKHKKKTSIFFSVRDRFHLDGLFSKDLYKVGFYGNSQYAGKMANFNNFNLNIIRYQQIQLGIFSAKLDSAARWGIGLSFLKGEQYLSVSAPRAELFTSEDGQYIDFNTELYVAKSDATNKGFGAFNGYGSSVDIYFEAPFKTRYGDSKLRVSIADIGFIRFNNQTQVLKQDSLFHYTGFNVNSFFDLQDSTFGGASNDTVINSIAPFKKQSYSATLPAIFDLTFETHFSPHFHLIAGIRNVFNGNYKLMYYARGNFYFSPNFMMSTTFGYGGYGGNIYGLGISFKLNNGILFYAGSNNIEGYISPKKGCGQGSFFTLVKQF